MSRIWNWFLVVMGTLVSMAALFMVLGVAITWSQAESDLPKYLNARECNLTGPACYQTLPATVVNATYQTYKGDTTATITVRSRRGKDELRPTGSFDLDHDQVHPGDQVEVRYWQGQPTLLRIHEDSYPTDNDPRSTLSSTPPGLALFGGFALAGLALVVYAIRRLRRQTPPGLRTARTPQPTHVYAGPPVERDDPSTTALPATRFSPAPVRWRWLLPLVAAPLLKVAFDFARGATSGAWGWFLLDLATLGGIAVLIGAAVVGSRGAAILVGPDAVTLVGVFGRRRTCSRGDIDRIVRLSITSGAVPIPTALVLDRANYVLMKIPRGFDVDRLAGLLGKPVEGSWDDVQQAGAVSDKYHGAAGWVTRNSTALGVGIALILCSVAGIAVFAFGLGGVVTSH